MLKMKKMLAMLLAFVLLAGCVPALAEEAVPAVVEIIELPTEPEAAESPETVEETPVPAEEPAAEPAPAAEVPEEPVAESDAEISAEPLSEETAEPVIEPVPEITAEPDIVPSPEATAEIIPEPSEDPTVESIAEESAEPSVEPTIEPSVELTVEADEDPSMEPTIDPTIEPTPESTAEPTPEPVLPQIVLNAEAVKLGVSEKFTLTAALESNEAAEFTFTCGNAKIATVDKKGLVTAKKVSETVITVTCGELIAECAVTVVKAPTKVTLSASKLSMGAGQTAQLTAELNNGNESAVTFTSSNKKVAAVDENGMITAIGKGTAKITAKAYNGKSAVCTVTVLAAPTELKLDAYELILPAGMPAQLKASVNKNAAADYAFASSNESVASVDVSGNIAANNPGTAIITVTTYNGLTAQCAVTVTPAPTAVSLSTESSNLGVSEKLQLIAGNDQNCEAAYTYASANTKIATVDKNGLVTAKKTGTTTITVTSYNGLTASCEITVGKAPTKVTLSAKTLSMGVGQVETLAAELNSGSVGAISFTSSKPTVAAVDENGAITAVAAGKATITAKTYNGKKATCAVTVLAAPTQLSLAQTSASLPMGMSLDLKPTVEKSAMANYVCVSSDESVATVDNNGKVTAVNPGSATITISTYNGLAVTCEVTVTPAPTVITLNAEDLELGVGEKFQIVPTVDQGDDAGYTYKSSKTATATVDKNGLITAKKAGTTTITVTTFNGVTAQCAVTVKKAPTKVSLNEKNIELEIGESFQLTAALNSGAAGKITFTSDNGCIIIDETGLVTAVSAGEATVTAETYNGKKAACEVMVVAPPVVIILDPQNISLKPGHTAQLNASLSEGEAAFNYESSDESVAIVDENGLITAISNGEAIIIVTTETGFSASCALTVDGPYATPAYAFDYIVEENGCTITGYHGEDMQVVIPDAIEGIPVVALSGDLGSDAYSFEIPASIASISAGAFRNCWNLHEIILAGGNSRYEVKDGVLYENSGTLLCYPAQKSGSRYDIPSGCTGIAAYAFSHNYMLRWLSIPNSVTEISTFAFENNDSVLIVEKGSAAEKFAKEQCLEPWEYQAYAPDLSEEKMEGEFQNADLIRAEKLGLDVDCADENTVTAAEYMQMLDWFISQAAPDRLDEWKTKLPNARASEQPFGRDDAMMAMYCAATFVGESYLVEMNDSMSLNDYIGDFGKTYDPDQYFFEGFWNENPAYDYSWKGTESWCNGYFFVLGQGSRYTSARLLDYDPVSNSMRSEDLITPEEALASVVRLLDAEEVLPVRNETSAAEKEIEDSIDAQREAILNSESEYEVKGKVYYVSPNGDDNNDGLSPETAFKTLDKINSAALNSGYFGDPDLNNPDYPEFINISSNSSTWLKLNPGDVVLFERGMEWRGMLRAVEGVTYSAYGEGEKPVINSSPESGVGAGKWELVAGTDNIWKFHSQMQDCGGILLGESQVALKTIAHWDGEKYIYVGDQTYVDLTNGGFEIYEDFSWKHMEDLTFFHYVDYSDGREFNCAHYGELYMRCDAGNPGLIYDDIEFFTGSNSRNHGALSSYGGDIIVDNLCFLYSSSGISIDTWPHATEDHGSVIIRNCEIGWCGGKQANNGEIGKGEDGKNYYFYERSGDGIMIFGSNAQVHNNYIHHTFDFGITIEGFSADVPEGEELPANRRRRNNSVTNNLIEYCGGGVLLMDFTTTDSLKDQYRDEPTFENILISGNTITYAAEGWSHLEDKSTKNSVLASITVGLHPSYKGIEISDNLLYKSRDTSQLVSYSYFGDVSGVMNMSGNTYVQDENGGLGIITTSGAGGDLSRLNTYRFTYSDYAALVIKHLLTDAEANFLPTDLLALGLGPIAVNF